MALAEMAKLTPGQFAGAGDIAKTIGAPQNYLGKLLKSLTNSGLVVSQKGFRGGFRLARPADEISLFEVVDPIDKISRWGNCFMGHGFCNEAEPCAVHHQWKSIREQYLGFLHETSLLDLVQQRVSL